MQEHIEDEFRGEGHVLVLDRGRVRVKWDADRKSTAQSSVSGMSTPDASEKNFRRNGFVFGKLKVAVARVNGLVGGVLMRAANSP